MSKYLTDLVERVVASFAGGFLSVTGLDLVDVLHLDWRAALGVGAGASLVALLKGLAAKWVGNPESASLTPSADV
jgi:hypothetical protein